MTPGSTRKREKRCCIAGRRSCRRCQLRYFCSSPASPSRWSLKVYGKRINLGSEIFKTALLRGAEILGLGLLLRVQEFVLGYPKSPWTDLLKVDVLNILGVSIIFMALFWRLINIGRCPRRALAGEAHGFKPRSRLEDGEAA